MMRKLLILALAGLLLGAAIVALIERDAGYVLISYGGTSIQTSVWVGLILWLTLWILIALVLRGFGSILRGKAWMSGWLGSRKVRNAGMLTNRGLISYIEGHWGRARNQLLRAARYSNAPLINYLIAAQASYRLGDQESIREYLRAAESVDSEAGVALELTQAELQLRAGRYEQALATLVRARKNAGKHPYVLELLSRAYEGLEDWSSLKDLLPEMRKHSVMPEEQLQQIELHTWQSLLKSVCDKSDNDALESAWQSIPKSVLKENPELRTIYTACLVNQGATAKAERLIVDSLERQWSPEMARQLTEFAPSNPKKLLTHLKRWMEQHGKDPGLLLAAGRCAMYAEDWDAAQGYLQDVYSAAPSAAICLELARLRDAMGDKSAAAQLVSEAARLGAGPLPEVPLPTPKH